MYIFGPWKLGSLAHFEIPVFPCKWEADVEKSPRYHRPRSLVWVAADKREPVLKWTVVAILRVSSDLHIHSVAAGTITQA